MMPCTKHFESEFHQMEKWVKIIGIPFFTLFSILLISPFPFNISGIHLLYHVVFSLLGVAGIWVSIRFIILIFQRRCGNLNFTVRFILQLILSSIVAALIIWILDRVGIRFMHAHFELCKDDQDFDEKNLYLSTILYAFLINTIYECFYLFVRLSQTAIENEQYKKESAEAKYQNLTSRLNPHFLFNSLNTLTTIVEEDPKKAVNFIRELSVVYRYVLSGQKLTWADLNAELKFTQSYILLLKMRFEEDLQITLDVCSEFLNYHILPMTVQLLIENAVKHNEISKSHPLEIKVFCENGNLVVTNRKQKRNIMPATTKVGLHNISERYRFLVNREVIIEDLENTFTVKIPLIKTIGQEHEHIEDYE